MKIWKDKDIKHGYRSFWSTIQSKYMARLTGSDFPEVIDHVETDKEESTFKKILYKWFDNVMLYKEIWLENVNNKILVFLCISAGHTSWPKAQR